jgi:hypothetical protein
MLPSIMTSGSSSGSGMEELPTLEVMDIWW